MNLEQQVTDVRNFVMTTEAVRLSLERDRHYAQTHKLTDADYELPSGIDKLPYVMWHGDPEINQFRGLAHLKTGEFLDAQRVYKNHYDLTWRVRQSAD